MFLPHDERDRERDQGTDRADHRRRRADAARLARRADRQPPGRRQRQGDAAGLPAGVHRRGATPARPPSDAAQRFERKLYVIRKRVEHAVDTLKINALSRRFFYIVSLSANTLIYKGMLTARQLEPMFPDLADRGSGVGARARAPALQHQHVPVLAAGAPVPLIAHNGEINTLRGNINWMRAREGLLQSELFGDDLAKLLPVIREGGSDTATFDNVLELLVMAGRSLPHAILMMIPEPWSNHESMSPERKAFYEYHSSLMEPWDGPASIAFTDGTVIGAVLDRNGLRPSRYYVTKDDLVIMASEVGVLDIPPRERPREGAPAPGQDLPRRHGQGPHRRRRGDQARAGGAASVPRVARRAPHRHRRPARRRAPSSRSTRPCSSGSRRSATRRRTCAC